MLYAPLLFTFNYVLGGFSALFFDAVRVTTPIDIEDCDVTNRSNRKGSAWYFLLLTLIIGIIFSAFNIIILGYNFHIFEYLDMLIDDYNVNFLVKFYLAISGFGLLVTLVAAIVLGIVYFFTESSTWDKLKYFFTSNLFIQYLKAVKNKACPIIEYVDPNSNKDSGDLR
jgi:Tfp pilus assembly protein PilO